jgi:hypothetical protein
MWRLPPPPDAPPLAAVRRIKPAMLIEEPDGTVTEPVTPASDDLST